MTRKLSEMNGVIGQIAEKVDSETVLFVMGDHGMTDNGDHGGDSDAEVKAGLFVYSQKFNFTANSYQSDAVEQVDFVPTLSLLLGSPIPFSNLGKIVPDLFFSISDLDLREVMSYLKVLEEHFL